MTREQKLTLKKERLNRLQSSPKNIKSGGIIKRLKREIRNMESSM